MAKYQSIRDKWLKGTCGTKKKKSNRNLDEYEKETDKKANKEE